MRDELHLSDQNRHNHFHGNDSLITVEDLWKSWVSSEVHNWTSKEVVSWLVDCVHLPQYSEAFKSYGVNGSMLPRLATKHNGFLHADLGVKDPKHRKKISLRAMDVILFGPPASGHNFLKDIVVAFSVLIATVGCWFAVHQKRRAKQQIEQTMRDLKVLQQAEKNFADLQARLAAAEEDHQRAMKQKGDLETRLQEEIDASKFEAERLQDAKDGTKEQLQRLYIAEQELMQVRKALRKAERELEYRSWKAPEELAQWLHITYTKESRHFQMKRTQALKQMTEAKDACDRIRKKRNSFIGSFRMAHDLTIDEVDQQILAARAALADVTNEMEERQRRWYQIEALSGLPIMSSSATSGLESESVVSQAIANVANIGSVGTGRKVSGKVPLDKHRKASSDNRPEKASHKQASGKFLSEKPVMGQVNGGCHGDEDLPPTYSSVTGSRVSLAEGVDTSAAETGLIDVTLSSQVGTSTESLTNRDLQEQAAPENLALAVNPRPSQKQLVLVLPSPIPPPEGIATTSTSEDPPPRLRDSPSGNKSKKRHSWFAGKKDSFSDGESSIENDEESRRKKIKRLWKRALLKTKAESKKAREKGKLPSSASADKLSKEVQSASNERLAKPAISLSSEALAASQTSGKLKSG
ncbi:stromal interaction molecule 1 isoform X2 [Nematostella vectensis]|nr:stromal interaction molecule 1 isoform X2 [Nematostella vectensis]